MKNVIICLGLILTLPFLVAGPSQQILLRTATSGVAPPTPDIVWLKMNEGSGTALNNDAAGAVDFTTNAGWGGGGLTFNGSSQQCTSDSSITYGASIVTLSMWVTLDSNSVTQELFLSAGSSTSCFGVAAVNTNEWYAYVIGPSGGDRVLKFTLPSLGVLTNVAFVFDNSAAPGNIKCFYNGVEQTATSTSGSNVAAANFAPFTAYIGYNGTNNWYDGSMDDFRIYTGELTGPQILAIYNAGPQ